MSVEFVTVPQFDEVAAMRAAGQKKFGYDAAEPSTRRRQSRSRVVREDYHTRGGKRDKLQETASELCRNLSLAAWMVRCHLDYVAPFDFHGRNEDEELNEQLEKLMEEDSGKEACDVSGRFGREKMFRIAEARRVLDGDVLLVFIDTGQLQGIQADLMRDPLEYEGEQEWVGGVRLGSSGRTLAFGVHRRTDSASTKFARLISAKNAIHYGFFDRFAGDQVRGISPLVAALNPLQDVYENFTLALAKAKVSQLFAMSIFRDAEQSAGFVSADPAMGESDRDGDGEVEPNGYSVDFTGGPQLLDMAPGDRAEFLESKQPSSEFQSFTQLVIQVAMKALDLPFSFYDESFTNFFGSRSAWLKYERSCKDKRDDQIEMRTTYTRFKLSQWVRDDRLVLPAGMTIDDVMFEWVPRGMPWWDPAKEIKGHVQAMKAGLDTPQRICKSSNTDFYDNVDQLAKAHEYAKSKGVELEFAMTPEVAQPVESEDE